MTDFDLQMSIAKLAESLLPDDELRQQKANAVVIAKDGHVRDRVLAASLPWYRVDVSIPGVAVAGSSVRRVPFPQGGRLRHISLHAKSAPSSDYTIRVTAGGESQYFSLQAGASTVMRSMNIAVNPGSWAIIDVMNAGGAADVVITLQYAVLAGGSSSAGSGGSSSGGGGTAVWGEIGGTLLHQADLSSALAGKASVSHDHDGTYSPATHTHAYSDLTGTPTIPTTLAALDTTVTGAQLNALKTKVDGIASGATANATNAQLRDRATHTGTQPISTVSGLQTALDGKADDPHTHDVSDLTATGTRNSTTILYGDNTWKTAPSGGGGVTDHTLLTSIGTNTHAQIDSHIASTGNPHSVTKAQVGLANVDNTSDANKPVSTAQASALAGKANAAHTHVATTDLTATGTKSSATYLRGDNTWNTPTNTTYTEITEAEITTGTASTLRTITARRMQFAINKARLGLYTEAEVDALIAAAQPITFGKTWNSVTLTTTDITESNPAWSSDYNVYLTPGTWRINVTVSAGMKRSVDTNGYNIFSRIDGVSISTFFIGSGREFDNITPKFLTQKRDVIVTSARNVAINVGVSGNNTAGTTWGYDPALWGSATRIGDA